LLKVLGKKLFKWVGYVFCACTALGLLVYAAVSILDATRADMPLMPILKAITSIGIAGFMAWNARQLLTDRFTPGDQEHYFQENPSPQKLPRKNQETIIIDGNNVFLRGQPNPFVLHLLVKTLSTAGHLVHVFFDANIYYVLRENHVTLSGKGKHHSQVATAFGLAPEFITIVPAGSQADHFIIPHAQECNGTIISNDRFNEFREKFPWLGTPGRLAKFDVINEHLSVPDLDLSISLQ